MSLGFTMPMPKTAMAPVPEEAEASETLRAFGPVSPMAGLGRRSRAPFSMSFAVLGQPEYDISDSDEDAPPAEAIKRSSTAPACFHDRSSRPRTGRAVGKLRLERQKTLEAWIPENRDLACEPEERAKVQKQVKENRACALLAAEDVDRLLDSMEYFRFESQQILVQQGGYLQYFFVVSEGLLKVASEDGLQPSCLRPGDTYGGTTLLYHNPEPAAVTSQQPTAVWGVRGETFRSVLMSDEISRGSELTQALDAVPLFDGLTADQKLRVGKHACVTEVYEPGEQVDCEQTLMGLAFVKSGELVVKPGLSGDVGPTAIESKPSEDEDTRLVPGTSLNDVTSLLRESAGSVEVVAETRCEVVRVASEQLRAVLGDDVLASLETGYLVKCFQKSALLSQFSSDQQRRIVVEGMHIQSLEPSEPFEVTSEFVAVVDGELCEADDPSTVTLGRGEVWEDYKFRTWNGVVRKRSRRSLSATMFSSNSGLQLGPSIAGPSGCRLATLTHERLVEVLKEMGISGTSEEAISRARKALLAKKVVIFHHLSQEEIDMIVQSFILVRPPCGEVVFAQGEPATDMWIIARGEVEELRDGVRVRTLGKYGHFGVRAFLHDRPRCSTLRVVSEKAEFWQLEKETFFQIVTGSTLAALKRYYRLKDPDVQLKDLRPIALLGAGTFGSVRCVEHKTASMKYALKRVKRLMKRREKLVVDAAVVEHLERECAILAELDHPLVLQLVRTFHTDKSVYILTELLVGGDLLMALDEIARPLWHDEAQFYAGSLVIVLEALHDRSIVFRDLKPENVMIDEQGYIRLIDFGTAKKLDPEAEQPKTFTVIGSHHFMAPEVPKGRGYGTEVDLWSLGVMVFEFVCGHLPFGHSLEDPSGLQIFQAVQTQNLTFPERYVDPSGRHLIRELLRKSPDRRLGYGLSGFQVIKDHDFFKVYSPQSLFDGILARALKPPLIPDEDTFLDAAKQGEFGGNGMSLDAFSDVDEFG